RWFCSNWQLASQPSRFAVFPSSHCSPGSRIPLPQNAAGVVVDVVVLVLLMVLEVVVGPGHAPATRFGFLLRYPLTGSFVVASARGNVAQYVAPLTVMTTVASVVTGKRNAPPTSPLLPFVSTFILPALSSGRCSLPLRVPVPGLARARRLDPERPAAELAC